MSRKILFFINPISGGKNKLQLEKKIVKKCEERNTAFDILFTSKDGNYSFLPAKIKTDEVTDIVICGGDGSLSPIVESVLKQPVNIGIVPLGSGNGLAKTAKIPNSIDKALDTIFTGEAAFADAFTINNKLSCHASGLGFDARVALEFSKRKERGLATYAQEVVKNFFAAPPFPFYIETEIDQFNVEAFLIFVAISNQFGNNFKITPKASICDGLLDVVVLRKTTKPQAVLSFVKQLISGGIGDLQSKSFYKKNILYFQTKKLKIMNPGLALLHIDGDPAETAKEFSIEILPGAYQLIQPL